MKKILVADDESLMVATLKYNFERDGYSVVTASDGPRALTATRESNPDLIVLDLMMGGLSGLEVCRILRRETQVPILILSARGEEAHKATALTLGADDYVTKPFSMRDLMERVRVLSSRSA